MNPAQNPYSPGAGRTPTLLVGRDHEVRQWMTSLERVERGRFSQPFVLYGRRGVGKTVLLSHFMRAAEGRDWITAQIEAGAGKNLRAALGERLHGPLADIARPNAGKRLLKALRTAVSFKASYDTSGTWNFGIDLDNIPGGGADTGVLETDLMKLVKDLAAAAEEEKIGLAILIDEAQELTKNELASICTIAHIAGQNEWTVLFALAGLPSLPRKLGEAKSYAERMFIYQRIEELSVQVSREALLAPSALENVTWQDDAVELIVTQTKGYPYFLQQLGYETWNEADATPITLADARVGSAQGWAALDNGFYRVRWERATETEQEYLRAMSMDGDNGSESGEVAERLGKKPGNIGQIRARLITKGLIYAPRHGNIAFTVPGMAAFIQHQPEN